MPEVVSVQEEPCLGSIVKKYRKYSFKIVHNIMSSLNVSPQIKEDLLSAADIALIECATKYDRSRKETFAGYVALRVKGAVYDELRNINGCKSKTSMKMLNALRGVNDTKENENKSRTEPELKLLEEASKCALIFCLASAEGVGVEATKDMKTPDAESTAIFREHLSFLADSMDVLSFKERFVIEKLYFEDLTYPQIGAQLAKAEREVFNLEEDKPPYTKGWISRIHSKALSKLNKSIRQSSGGDISL